MDEITAVRALLKAREVESPILFLSHRSEGGPKQIAAAIHAKRSVGRLSLEPRE